MEAPALPRFSHVADDAFGCTFFKFFSGFYLFAFVLSGGAAVAASGSLSNSHRSSTVSSPTHLAVPAPDLLSDFDNMSVRNLIAKFEALAATTAARATSSYRSSNVNVNVNVHAHIQHYESLRRSTPTPTAPSAQDQDSTTLATPPQAATLISSSVPSVEKVQMLLSDLDVVIINASLARPEKADASTYKPAFDPAPPCSAATSALTSITIPAFKKSRCQGDDQRTQTNKNGCSASAVPAPVATLPRLAARQLLPTQAVATSAPPHFGMPRRCLNAVKSRLFAFREDPKFLRQCAESRQRRKELATTNLPTWRR